MKYNTELKIKYEEKIKYECADLINYIFSKNMIEAFYCFLVDIEDYCDDEITSSNVMIDTGEEEHQKYYKNLIEFNNIIHSNAEKILSLIDEYFEEVS